MSDTSAPAYRRILLKLSGEALRSPGSMDNISPEIVARIAEEIAQAHRAGVQIGLVVGGGNFWRGRSSDSIDRTKADQIGMLATVMNCIYVSEIFRSEGMMTNVLTPFECGSFTKLFSKDRANKYFSKNMVVFLCRRYRTSVFLNRYRRGATCCRGGC